MKMKRHSKPDKPKNSQHFMTDVEAIRKICGYAKLNNDDVVLEIGAGTGNLTFEIARFSNVYAIEKDGKLITCLTGKTDECENSKVHVHVLNADALKIEFPKFNKVVANMPYAISRKITLKLLKNNFELGILVYQKEFAEKLIADAGSINYRFITVAARSFWDIRIIEYLPQSAFSPEPNVKSAIVEVTPKFNEKFRFDGHYIEDYIKFVRNLFNRRNKNIKEINKRVYELSPDEILELYNNQKLKYN